MKKKVEPRIMDVERIDRELSNLFKSIKFGSNDVLMIKYRSRFLKQQNGRQNPDMVINKYNTLSLAKKLEILCLYGGYTLVKLDRRANSRHSGISKSDNNAVKK